MLNNTDNSGFAPINRGYNTVFRPNKLSLGLVVPIESYSTGPVPTMIRQVERIQLAEELGFSAIWLRDVPFNVPSFGDAGQIYDPFVYLGLLALFFGLSGFFSCIFRSVSFCFFYELICSLALSFGLCVFLFLFFSASRVFRFIVVYRGFRNVRKT